MRRGTTPTLRFTTPYCASLIEGGYITFSQRGRTVIEKGLMEEGVTIEDKCILVDLTQSETLNLSPVDDLKIQIRCILPGGKRSASNIVRAEITDILKDGEI